MSTNPFDAFGPQGFDRSSEEPSRGYEPIPPGKYPVQIEKVEVRETKKKDGSYLWIEMNIFDGPQKGRKVWANLNLDNKNEQAVKIARKELSAILYAVELQNITHPDQLVSRWLYVSVRIKEDQNDVNGYYHPQDPIIVKYLQDLASRPAPTQAASYAPPAAAYAPPPQQPVYQPPQQPQQPVYQAPVAAAPQYAAPVYQQPQAAPQQPQQPVYAPPAAPGVPNTMPGAPSFAPSNAAPPQQPSQTAGKPPWAT